MSFRFNQGDRPLPGYTIQRGVGRGGFGEVYYAVSDGGKEVALKFLRENPQVELRGATHCLNLKSPYLVAIQDIKQSPQGEFFVIMEFVNGPSLRDLMNEEPRGLGSQKAAFFVQELAKGLAYLHDRGIVHRDLKPGNIFYEDGYVKIGDYGLSKMMAASQHSGQTVSVGTVHYMAPEVGSGNYDRTIDIYALGVILYEMLLGRVPFSGSSMGEVLMKHLTAQPEVDELPAPFPSVIRKALAKDPRDRYQTVNEMMADLFAVEDLSRSVASMDSLNLTRMAAAVAQRVKVGAGAAGTRQHVGPGSSHVQRFGGEVSTPPPPIVERPNDGERAPKRQRNRKDQLMVGWQAVENASPADGAAPTFPQRSRVTTGLLGVVLGWLGIHRFYTGHYGIGVYQILVTMFTGIGALWGIIEGIVILMNGDFRDAHGRALVDRSVSDPTYRNVIVRAIWGLASLVTFAASLVFAAVGTFAEPEFERVTGPGAVEYHINVMQLFYIGAAATICISMFSLWKSTHRGGYSTWRLTLRPALMAATAFVAGAAIIGAICFVPPNFQVGLLSVSVVSGLGFLCLWMLRGYGEQFRVGDVYWNRALMSLFIVLAVTSAGGATLGAYFWSRTNFSLHTPDSLFRGYEEITITNRYSSGYGDRRSQRQIRVPSIIFNGNSVVTIMLGLLTIGSLAEADYRRRASKRAKQYLQVD